MRLQKRDVWRFTRKNREWLKGLYQSTKEVNEQYGRKINQDVDGNRKLFWKEGNKMKGWKVETCSRIKDGNGKQTLGEDKYKRYGKSISRIYII